MKFSYIVGWEKKIHPKIVGKKKPPITFQLKLNSRSLRMHYVSTTVCRSHALSDHSGTKTGRMADFRNLDTFYGQNDSNLMFFIFRFFRSSLPKRVLDRVNRIRNGNYIDYILERCSRSTYCRAMGWLFFSHTFDPSGKKKASCTVFAPRL